MPTGFLRFQHNRVLLLPVLSGDKKLAIGDEIADSHPGVPGIPSRVCYISPQRDGILKLRRYRGKIDDIAIRQGMGKSSCIKWDFLHVTQSVIYNVLDINLAAEGGVA